ncbi:MAG: 23S rRNA (adenine(2503)-C(2))-methyltransferase RlmN [Opitutaceae bacterium]|jgi:23S rRNA (adenine2503-C2)-methyltransferase|nr:23S rRNA (adenine(2503)-C(2))-methyltransferase RlmN [Opitutaceae bacterium]
MKTPADKPPNLLDLTRDELRALVESWGLSPVHAARLWNYLYYEAVDSLDAMPALPARLRARLAAECRLEIPPVAREARSADGFTRKFLLGLGGGARVETVLMRFTGRVTACLSSQAGCAMGCVFCATGQAGFSRNLTAGEIVAQALHVKRVLAAGAGGTAGTAGDDKAGTDDSATTGDGAGDDTSDDTGGTAANTTATAATTDDGGTATTAATATAAGAGGRLRNVVLMGMGEPLHNYDAVMRAADILRDPAGLALGARKITLSTVGVVPGILRMADEARPIHLAVSLHAATQEERAALVPAARRWPLDELMAACRRYCAKTRRRIFFEWTLIAGKNDSPAHARAVARLLEGMDAQVNLIPLNPTSGYGGAPGGGRGAARAFQDVLAARGLPATVRQRRGLDIAAGCGQLAATPGA